MDNHHPSLWTRTSSHETSGTLNGEHNADVVIVGAGLTGITAALLLVPARTRSS